MRDPIEQMRATGGTIAISENGQTIAFLVHPDEYHAQRRRLTLMDKLVRGEQDHREGRTHTQEEVEALLDEWLPDESD